MKISTLYALSLCKAMVTVAALAIAPTSAVAGEYSHEVIELPSAQPVCHIKKNGEFLAEIPPCFSVSGVDVPGGHWLVIAKLWFDLEAEDYTGVYVFDEVSRSMTDSIFAITYDGIIQDGETTVVMTSHQKHVVWDPLLNEGAYMPRAHALRGGKFTEIDPTPYADWTYLAVDTAWYISWLFAHSFTCTSSDLNPRFYNCQSYILSTRQLREIFTYIDRREPAEHVGGSDVVVAHSGDLTKTKAYIDALNKHIKEF
nr:hypothetical protein [Gammaproteobacteria bacterium]